MSLGAAAERSVARYAAKRNERPADATFTVAGRPPPLEQTSSSTTDDSSSVQQALADAYKNVSNYAPTEVLGVYIPILAAVGASSQAWVGWLFFTLFLLIITPVAIMATFVVKARQKGQPRPENLRDWPWWSIIAGLIVFAAYAVALPGSVFHTLPWYSDPMGFVAVIVSAVALHIGSEVFDSGGSPGPATVVAEG